MSSSLRSESPWLIGPVEDHDRTAADNHERFGIACHLMMR
jgi:hypothetical protein